MERWCSVSKGMTFPFLFLVNLLRLSHGYGSDHGAHRPPTQPTRESQLKHRSVTSSLHFHY